jgi:hypothetical protein
MDRAEWVKETGITGRSLADVRSKSLLHYQAPVPLVREGDIGDPLPGTIDRCRIVLPRGAAVTAAIDTRIVWRPNSLRATFVLSISHDGGVDKLLGDVNGDLVVQQDRAGRHVLAKNHDGHVQLRVDGVDNLSGQASVTGSVQLCT